MRLLSCVVGLVSLAFALFCSCHGGFVRTPCTDVDCAGHGHCFESLDGVACLCDDGYGADGLECVSIGADGDADGDGDGDADGDADPCASSESCDRCTTTAACGWCASTSGCMTGTASGPAAGSCADWSWESDDCVGSDPCAGLFSCSACVAGGTCGWCQDSSSCLAGTDAGPSSGSCGAWRWGYCPGTWVDPGPEGPEVRVVYLYPTDRPERADYALALERAARHAQTWYREHLGTGETFRVHDPVVEIVAGAHPASWYATNDTGGSFDSWWFDNTRDELMALTGAVLDDPQNGWVFYADSDSVCGQMGGASAGGIATLPANDLRGLAGEAGVKTCPDDPDSWYTDPPCRWVGGLALMLAYGFGLSAPPGCDAGEPTCDEGALTWAGFYVYPETYLHAEGLAALGGSPFFALRDALPTFDCNAP